MKSIEIRNISREAIWKYFHKFWASKTDTEKGRRATSWPIGHAVTKIGHAVTKMVTPAPLFFWKNENFKIEQKMK